MRKIFSVSLIYAIFIIIIITFGKKINIIWYVFMNLIPLVINVFIMKNQKNSINEVFLISIIYFILINIQLFFLYDLNIYKIIIQNSNFIVSNNIYIEIPTSYNITDAIVPTVLVFVVNLYNYIKK